MIKGMVEELWCSYKQTIILIIVIPIIIYYLPNKNLITINLAVLVPILVFKAIQFYDGTLIPLFQDWAKTIIITICWVSGFYLLAKFAGLLGVVGIIGFLATVITIRLYKARKLLNYTFNWGADYLETGKVRKFKGFKK